MRDSIINAYRMDETTCINHLLSIVQFSASEQSEIKELAKKLVEYTREHRKKQPKIDALLHQYDLTTEEGIALMCLAEALLRIPDKTTIDRFISDKISHANWKTHIDKANPFFVNAASWSLLLTGKVYANTFEEKETLLGALKRTVSRMGAKMIRPLLLKMMKAIGDQFVLGETIETALKRSAQLQAKGYLFSYDMLGEVARTKTDAANYYRAYLSAIEAMGTNATDKAPPYRNPGISIKLSALHPRYEYAQHDLVIQELTPLVLALVKRAKSFNLNVTIDAEEADRLDLSLDIFELLFKDPALNHWEGLGLAVQAYQKRASYVIDWLRSLAREQNKRILVRLVKGAYWDAEIKLAQVQGQHDYPVFTRKHGTDVSFLACAKQLLSDEKAFYPQFGTHNAYSIAAILTMAKGYQGVFEFQCLHGMGQPLYDQLIGLANCRIYAPVGTHKELLGYLVRRLLENGANSSFVNQLAHDAKPIEEIIIDPVFRIAALTNKSHPRIPLPRDIYGFWKNSPGVDLSNPKVIMDLYEAIASAPPPTALTETTSHEAEEMLKTAFEAQSNWALSSVEERVKIINHAAELFEEAMPAFIKLLIMEGKKCIPDAVSEVREAIDYCHYYAYRAKEDLAPRILAGPTGELNQFSLHPRGMVVCISPWNFPIAIFSGQVIAALLAGNTVIAKPAEQTPSIAKKVVELLHQAGIPKEVLQLAIGKGETIGQQLVSDPRIAGVMFTGGTETAKAIERTLAKREGSIAFLIAETGGQNAMIVDSTALLEQTVFDIAQSAFNSAGQRCSALRVLFVQEDIANPLLTMLSGYMNELVLGNPSLLSTDIGPVIDQEAYDQLKAHSEKMKKEASVIAEVPLPPHLMGHFFAPIVFEIADLKQLKREIFGPILHVIRYHAKDLGKVMAAIQQTGYGLTLGVQSRIETTSDYITSRMPVGNMYVNRNMIGAVVGVQPFGGEHLSGTGPKAGGPYYLPRLCVERTISINTTAIGGNARLISLLEDD